MAETSGKEPDLEKIEAYFRQSRREDGSIGLDDYIEAYNELVKFFDLFGTVFAFVVSDVTSKISILREHRSSNCGPHYITVQSMVDFEVERGITKHKTKLPSGSRTLLRLHRALEFISLFMQKIVVVADETGLASVATESYQASLSKHHPWLVRKGVQLALYTLPTKQQLIARLQITDHEVATNNLKQIINSIQPVYDTVQKVYADNGILNLP